jgi:hypothetical protein
MPLDHIFALLDVVQVNLGCFALGGLLPGFKVREWDISVIG